MKRAWMALRIGAAVIAPGIGVAACGVDAMSVDASRVARTTALVSDTLPPAVVIAKRPSVSEILDIILRERPTAAQLAGNSEPGSFPDGSDEAHVASILREYTSDQTRADRIAAALVKEGRKKKIGSSLLVGVLLTENPWLDPRATSFVGARGLMQVMPFHAGKWNCGSRDLFDIESNICHGVAILAENLGRSKSLPQALLGYNGCVRGTNTPDCWRYPSKVFREAGKTADAVGGIRPFSSKAVAARSGRARGASGG